MTVSLKTKNHYARRKFIKDHQPDPMTLRDCPQHKLAHPTEAQAKQRAALAFKADGKKLYPYKCPHCRRWHLTSMEQG